MSQDNQDQPAEEHPGIEAAYERSQKHENVGMRALAGLFLLGMNFAACSANRLGTPCRQPFEPFAPYDCAIFWTCSRRGGAWGDHFRHH